jgi:Spy/CpxP family protein refolding chaperone
MNRRFALSAMTLLLAIPVLALPGPGRARGGPGGARNLDFLAGYLSLSDTQKTQAKAIFDAAETASETVRGQLTSANDALKAGVKAGKSESELDVLAAAVGVLQGRGVGIRAKAEAKFYALLTAEQKTKYDELQDRSGPGRR